MPKPYTVILSAEAVKNIEEAFLWIEEADPDAARRWYEGLLNALRSLSTLPLRCPIAPEVRLGLLDRKIHQLVHGRGYWKYRILFAVEKDKVLIAHVRHGARLYLGEDSDDRE
jgi:plasmid stabilization system protein ParE